MSHALPAPHLDLDPKRIVATSGVIAIHVLALMLLLAPVQWSPSVATADDPQIQIIVPDRKIVPIDPPKPDPRPVVRPQQPRPQAPSQPIVDVPPVVTPDGDVPYVEPQIIADTFEPPAEFSGPVELTILEGPTPPYPVQAIRQGITGKVVLRIEVDANGRPVDGRIERSSGSRLLDQAALKFVLAKWRFVPAQSGGQAIASTALVPIDFSLN